MASQFDPGGLCWQKSQQVWTTKHKEAIQNIKHAENGEIVTLKVGDVSERMDIIEAIDSEIVHYLFDPGGSIRPNILCRPKES